MASKRRLRRKQCTGKVGHPDEASAYHVISAIYWKERALTKTVGLPRSVCPLQPYRCPHCGKWHIGHESNHNQKEE